MAPGPVEEAGNTARTLIDALKSDPLALSMIVINILLIVFLYLQAGFMREEHNGDMQLLYQNRKEVGELLTRNSELLAACYPAPPPNR